MIDLLILVFFLLLLIVLISVVKVHPFIALILTACMFGLAIQMDGREVIKLITTGFSETLGWIAMIIIVGSFIGEVLFETGGAIRISERIIKYVGSSKIPVAMGVTGYLVSIPVFVDVAYILLRPVVESLAVKSKKPLLYIGLSLTAGLTVSHTLIPPTPGPMAVASLLQIDLGKMILINSIVALFSMIGGVLWSVLYCRHVWISTDMTLKESVVQADQEEKGGNIIMDILPIIIPILLISLGSYIEVDPNNQAGMILGFICSPLVAVSIGATVAGIQYKCNYRKGSIDGLVEKAILKSALVIMITGAGGALGYIIKESGITNEITQLFSNHSIIGFMLPFFLAAILTTATGSITVSLVGSASLLGPIQNSLSFSPEITAALIGCGAFCIFHSNSSFFWLLNRLHNIPPTVLYKTFTMQSLIMGISGLLGIILIVFLT